MYGLCLLVEFWRAVDLVCDHPLLSEQVLVCNAKFLLTLQIRSSICAHEIRNVCI
jgi:hypothetical protein